MKGILSYDETKEKLEKIEIPDSVIDRVNEALEIMISIDPHVVGISLGDKPGEIKNCYALRLVQEIKKKGYDAYVEYISLWIGLNMCEVDCIENDGEKEEGQNQHETKSTEKPLKKSERKTFWQYVKHNYLWYVTFFIIPVVVCSLDKSARGLMVAITINLWLSLCLYFCYDRK